jgi:hypothetical protein
LSHVLSRVSREGSVLKTIKSHWAYAEKILRIEAKNYRKKAICDYTERPWATIYPLIMEEKFPAIKIKGRWESLTYLIDEWFAGKIRKVDK